MPPAAFSAACGIYPTASRARYPSKITHAAAVQRRPARSERKNRFFSRNDRFPQCSTDAAHTPGRRLSVSAPRTSFFFPHMGKYPYLPRDLHKYLDVTKNITLERFTFENGENARRRHSAARPEVSGKTAFFPRNDRPYGLKRVAFQTKNALEYFSLERFNLEKGKARGGGTAPPPCPLLSADIPPTPQPGMPHTEERYVYQS